MCRKQNVDLYFFFVHRSNNDSFSAWAVHFISTWPCGCCSLGSITRPYGDAPNYRVDTWVKCNIVYVQWCTWLFIWNPVFTTVACLWWNLWRYSQYISWALGLLSWPYCMALVLRVLPYSSLSTSGAYAAFRLTISPNIDVVIHPRLCRTHSPDSSSPWSTVLMVIWLISTLVTCGDEYW